MELMQYVMSKRAWGKMMILFPVGFIVCIWGLNLWAEQSSGVAEIGKLKITVMEKGGEEPVPCRFRLYGPEEGKLRLHQICDGNVELTLPAGRYRIVVERGPEYRREEHWLDVKKGETTHHKIQMRRLINLARLGWWSGELHVHLKPEEMKLNMLAEDLHVAVVLSYWNEREKRKVTKPTVVEFEPTRLYDLMGHEHEGGGTSVLFFKLKKAVPYDVNQVTSVLRAKEQGGWVEIEKPHIWATPAVLATGKVDSIEIAPNTLSWTLKDDFPPYKYTIKWGHQRDIKKYPGRLGFGYFIQDLYYRVLNCGFRIPPSAGTACGVRWVPVGLGYNRLYVYLDGGFDYKRWWEQFAAGRVFVTNGPLLQVRANGALPGEVFRSPEGEPVKVNFKIEVAGNDPIDAIEIIRDGKVVQKIGTDNLKGEIQAEPLVMEKSGWFLVRAIAKVPFDTLRFASTGPYYVEVGDKPKTIHRADVEYFLRWLDERINSLAIKYEDDPQKKYFLGPHLQGRAFFKELLKKAESRVENEQE